MLILGGIWKKGSISFKLDSIYPVLASKRDIPASKSPILESKSDLPLDLSVKSHSDSIQFKRNNLNSQVQLEKPDFRAEIEILSSKRVERRE
jgi:hypothetical protein